MGRVLKTKTWKDNWNNVIRRVLFPDEELRKLMLLPDDISIIEFIDKYFIQDENAGEQLISEPVRILYWDSEGRDSGNMNVRNKYKEFDIFVKEDVLHTATNDRLQNRYDQIAERQKYLLLKDTHVQGLRFRYEDDYNLWTKTIGYKRYHVVFSYKTSA